MLFEEMGFTYLGPIDGHNFADLFEVLKNANKTPGPVLVHVVTKRVKDIYQLKKIQMHFMVLVNLI